MMIQKRIRSLRRPFQVLLSLALVGGICSAPVFAADKSSKRSDRSSSSRSNNTSRSNKSSSQRSIRSQSSSSRSQSFSRKQSSQPKSSARSKSHRTTPQFKQSTPKSTRNVFDRGSQKSKPSFKVAPKSKSTPKSKVAPKSSRPDFKIPSFGNHGSFKLNTKDLKPRVPDRKIPDRKIPNRKVPNLKIPNRKTPDPKVPNRRVPDLKIPNLKPDHGKFVPKPGKNVVRPRPDRHDNNVFKPGKDVFKPGKGKQIPPVKGISRDDLFGKPGKKPGKTTYPGKIDLSKLKGKGHQFDHFKPSKQWLGKNGVPLNKDFFKGKQIKPINVNLDKQLKAGKLNTLILSKQNKNWHLKKQFELHKKGDVARQLKLNQNLLKHGGWRNRTLFGKMNNSFTKTHFGFFYAGSGFYPSYCWSPHWSAWVDWCWWDWCHPICDPRPLFCRPIICDPCGPWVWYDCPVWQPLPVVTCGTWVDVDPIVIDAGLDLQMLAVRFVDSGHPEQELGPRYRVWFRNNSDVDINAPFNVMLLASNSRDAVAGVPEAGSRVDNIAAGQIQSVDIRLPFAASTMSTDAEGNQVPFEQLHVLIDSHREIPEAFEENNGVVLPRVDVLPVDPALFSADTDVVMSGAMINLAGEGLGPEPGKVLISMNGMNFEAEIYGWYDLGVRIQVPDLPLVDAAEATLIVVRGDEAVSNPIDLVIAPQTAALTAE
ncbi:hypothetical protein Pan153_47660 [Gimesia panareensis]|uniref:IPT/TIG domain protein n=1 Tax=Gimesia panareensis TaxID=2527978 RepID=A0A518FUX8_9PLAN|nr:hypothetical protein [Gimesia panareensis]QDV20095.1 hypothetical protein Pan153_47660 [Gimesia panareensis]